MILEKRARDESSLAIWKANHTKLLSETVDKYKADGWKCQVERFFKVTGQTAIISGKADLIVQKPDERPVIIDVKSGSPRDSDVTQVLSEMILIPLAWNSPGMTFAGRVIYPSHTVEALPASAAEMKPKLFDLLKRLGLMRRPDASPSEHSCRFCDCTDADCLDRWKAEDAPVSTTVEF
jgi:hypothetical protein